MPSVIDASTFDSILFRLFALLECFVSVLEWRVEHACVSVFVFVSGVSKVRVTRQR